MSLSKKNVNNLLFLTGVAFIVVMIFTFDVSFEELWQNIRQAGYWMIPILGIWFILYLINAFAWKTIIYSNCEENERPSFWRIYRLTITGYALNNTTPVGGLGGEPYRIIELTHHMSKEKATSSTILYAMMHIYSHFWFWFTSIVLYVLLAIIGDLPINSTIASLLIFLVCFCCIGFYFFAKGYKNGLLVKVFTVLGKIPGLGGWSSRFLDNRRESLHRVDQQIAALHSQDKKSFYTALFLEWLGRMLGALEVTFILLMLGKDCGGDIYGYILVFLHSVLIIALTSFLANLLGFLPMQLGVQEGGYAAAIAAMGLAPNIGIFISLIVRVRQIVWDIGGVGLMKLK